MTRRLAFFIFCGGIAVVGVACATKTFVRERVSASESTLTERMATTQKGLSHQMSTTQTKLTERADLQETELRQTAERTGENRRAIDAADQRLRGLDTRVGEVGTLVEGLDTRVGEVGALVEGARTRADTAAVSAQDAEARLTQRFAGRNKYRLLDTKSVYFGSGQIELRSQDIGGLDEVGRALAADPNAILELQGFADPQGGDRYNRELARERVEAVIRYLVQRHGIELRQLQGIAMGKVALAPGEKPSAEVLARARRVDVRLLSPWSSWEDSQAQSEQTSPDRAASSVSAPAVPAIVAAPSDHLEPALLPRAALEDRPAQRLPELLRTITPKDLGAE